MKCGLSNKELCYPLVMPVMGTEIESGEGDAYCYIPVLTLSFGIHFSN